MIKNILTKLGYNVDCSMQEHISKWDDWYKGYVENIHSYTTYNGKTVVKQHRETLCMAKRICEDWANFLMNEKVSFSCSDKIADDKLHRAFDSNDFYVRANQLIEKTFAFGSGAFVEYPDADGHTVIDYVPAGNIYPLSWVDIHITGCAFGSIKYIGSAKYYYINIHTPLANGKFLIQNRLFGEKGDEIQLPSNVMPTYVSDTKRFQIIRPNITNNIEPDSPLGIAIYANATDELKGVDLIYDSYINEFRLGKKRIIVPVSLAQMEKESDGVSKPIFDNNDTVFYAIPGVEGEKQDLHEINMDIRSDEHKQALQYTLGLLADKCGLGNDRYEYTSDGTKTATEVISEKSDLFRNLKKHEIVILSALISLCEAVLDIEGCEPKTDVTISFDDSIIEDKNAEFVRRMQLVTQGIITREEFRSWYMNEPIETAAEKISESDIDDVPEV